MPTVLITGAAGGVGRFLGAGLPALGWQIRGFDLVASEDVLVGDIRDPAALDAALEGVDAVIHLAGISVEAPFADILAANIEGTYHLLEAVRRSPVRRLIYASSNHAVGFTARTTLLPVETRPRPDTYYGLSKVFGEGICSLYADKYGLEIAAIRIGSCFEQPRSVRMLDTWLSPDDAVRLFHACLTVPDLSFEVVYGISDNTRGWWDLAPARRLGYEPKDDSEAFAQGVLAEHGPLQPDDPEHGYVGGAWTTL